VTKKVDRMVQKAALRVVDIDSLQVDESYQRPVKGKHKKIAAEFDEVALGIPLVGEREDGSLWIVDGRQRIEALRKMGTRSTVRAEVFASRGPEHEAEVFKLVNMNRTRLTAHEEYKALLAAHDEDAWAVKEAVESCGYRVTHGGTRSDQAVMYVSAVNTLMYLQRKYGAESIKFALTAAKECWPGDKLGVFNAILMGLGRFWARYEGAVDLERLYPRLRSVTPQKILYSASQTVASSGGEATVQVLEKVYRKPIRNVSRPK
jgi:hypothetical protein